MTDTTPGDDAQEPTQPVEPVLQFSELPPEPPEGSSLPEYVESPPKRRRAGRLAAMGVGVVAIVAAGAFAVTALSDDAKGSESPEAAVRALFDAIGAEDVVGIAEALPSGERDALLDPIRDINGELKRLGIVDDSLDLEDVPGIDFAVEGLELATEELGAEVVAVRITGGTITVSTDPGEVPIGETLSDVAGGDPEVAEATETADLADAGIEVVAVHDDDGWHVSLFYTIAELARQSSGAPLPDFGNGVAPNGAGSPEDALRNFVDAAAAIDLEGIIAVLPPDEMRALQDYAPLFLDDAQAAVDEFRDEGWELRVDDLGVETTGSGDVRVAQITSFEFSGDSPDGAFDVSFDGDCFTVHVPDSVGLELPEGSGESDQVCKSDLPEATSDEVSEFVDELTQEAGFVVTEVGGQWYVSPVRTVFQSVIAAMRALEKEDIENFEDFLESMFGGVSVDEDGSTTDTAPEASTTTTAGTDTTVTAPGDATTTTTADGETGELQTPVPPDGLVADPEDCNGDTEACVALAQACYTGDMQSCDDLYGAANFGSDYESYGASCAGRLPDNSQFCIEAIGPTAPN